MSIEACRQCSRILNRLAFCRPASVRKPAQADLYEIEVTGWIAASNNAGVAHTAFFVYKRRLNAAAYSQLGTASEMAGAFPIRMMIRDDLNLARSARVGPLV